MYSLWFASALELVGEAPDPHQKVGVGATSKMPAVVVLVLVLNLAPETQPSTLKQKKWILGFGCKVVP